MLSGPTGRARPSGAPRTRRFSVINPLIYAEVSIGFKRIEELEVVPAEAFRRDSLPWAVAFLAGKCFAEYRRRGGDRRSPLPDFYIGAHAAAGLISTSHARRYRTYFPTVSLIHPA